VQIDPRTLVRSGLFALLGLLGLVPLVIAPWTGVVLILAAGPASPTPAALGELTAPQGVASPRITTILTSRLAAGAPAGRRPTS
jgi:hypothetical protein